MPEGDTYPIERESRETERLNKQNELLIKAVGYVLHPLIKDHLPPAPRIAEVGTGTGAFLASLSADLPPNAVLDGYDISPTSFLPPAQRPANLTLSLLDAKGAVPADLRGKYDVVCLRFMNAALPTPEDWTSVAEHAVALLKPETGMLQWIEGDFSSLHAPLQTTPLTRTSACMRGAQESVGYLPHVSWFTRNLRAVMEAAGLGGVVVQNIMSTDRVASAEGRREMSYIAMGAIQSVLTFRAAKGMEGALTGEEREKLMGEMREEVEAGAYFRCDLHQFLWSAGGIGMSDGKAAI